MEEQNNTSSPIVTSDNLQMPHSCNQAVAQDTNGKPLCVHGLIIETPQPNVESLLRDGETKAVESVDTQVLTDEEAIAVAQAVVVQKPLQGQVVEEKRAVGRPSKFNAGMIEKAKDYYSLCSGKKDGKKRMPFMEELAIMCDVNDDTLYEWMSLNEEFSETISKLKTLQKLRVIQQGFGAKNPTFPIFMLKANHGMMETEKQVLVQDRDVKVSITRE